MEYTRKIATERAVILYKNADVGLTSIFGDNALDSARRAHLVNDANAGSDAAIAQLTAAVTDLNAQRRSLEEQKAQQQKILSKVATERLALDAELAGVRALARHEANVALAAATRDRAAWLLAAARAQAPAAVSPGNPFAAPPGPPTLLAATPAFLTADNGQVSTHHNDPFLVCTRMRESAGQYDAVSPSGYYGAYQFLRSTWDSTAVHAGRRNLVGELPSRASQFDQDEMAWALYQWQGKGPWGGRC